MKHEESKFRENSTIIYTKPGQGKTYVRAGRHGRLEDHLMSVIEMSDAINTVIESIIRSLKNDTRR